MKVDAHVHLRRHGGAESLHSVPSVDPIGGETEGGRLDMVVVQALSGVQYVVLLDATLLEVLQHVLEVARVGLVGADVLGGVDGVELDAELRVAGGEARSIDV